MNAAVLRALLELREAGRPVALLTDLDTSRQWLVQPGDDDPLAEAAGRALRSDAAVVVEHQGRQVFVRPYNPRLRLAIVGAVHIAQALAAMATVAGWEVVVIDPRSSFASPERFGSVRLIDEWPDDALTALGIDARTAVVTLTHDPKLDDPALQVALRSDALYIGALGSTRTQARRRNRLVQGGLSEAQIGRLHAPIGLAIGASGPAEIAVSILAELTAVLRRSAPP